MTKGERERVMHRERWGDILRVGRERQGEREGEREREMLGRERYRGSEIDGNEYGKR